MTVIDPTQWTSRATFLAVIDAITTKSNST
jgi:hypothetical protein